MNKTKLWIFLLLISILTGCSNLNRGLSNLFFPPNPYSDVRANEEIVIEIDHQLSSKDVKENYDEIFSTGFTPGVPTDPFGFVPPAMAAAAAGFVIDQVQTFLKKEAERYDASYNAVLVDDKFYMSPNELAKINLKGISFFRKAGRGGAKANVMKLCVAVDPTVDQRGFQLLIEKPIITKTKAKLIAFDPLAPFGFDLLAPWTIFRNDGKWSSFDNNVDLTIQIFLYGVWIDQKGNPHTEQLVSKEVKFRNLELSDHPAAGIPSTCDRKSIIHGIKSKPEDYKTLLFNAIPRNYLGTLNKDTTKDIMMGKDSRGNIVGRKMSKNEKVFGAGNYILAVLVSEHDDYGEKVREIGKNLEENKEGIINRISSSF